MRCRATCATRAQPPLHALAHLRAMERWDPSCQWPCPNFWASRCLPWALNSTLHLHMACNLRLQTPRVLRQVLTKTIAEAAEAAAIAAAADVPSAADTPAPTAAPMDQADSPDTIMASPVSATPVSRMDHSESCSPATLAAKAMVAQIQIAGAQMGSTRAQLAVSGVALAFLVMCFFRVSQTA